MRETCKRGRIEPNMYGVLKIFFHGPAGPDVLLVQKLNIRQGTRTNRGAYKNMGIDTCLCLSKKQV
jgi:hypothetical protein